MRLQHVGEALASLERCERRRLRSGESLQLAGDDRRFVYVYRGALGHSVDRNGKRRVHLEVHGPGSWFLQPEAGPAAVAYDVVQAAIVPTELLVIPHGDVVEACARRPELTESLVDLSERNRRWLRERVAGLTERDPDRRLAATALYLTRQLADFCPVHPGGRIALSQSVLASAAGLARQTVNRILRRWSATRMLVLESRMVCILDGDAVVRLARGVSGRSGTGPAFCCALSHPRSPRRCTLAAGGGVPEPRRQLRPVA